jgi:hypothetical protein
MPINALLVSHEQVTVELRLGRAGWMGWEPLEAVAPQADSRSFATLRMTGSSTCVWRSRAILRSG